ELLALPLGLFLALLRDELGVLKLRVQLLELASRHIRRLRALVELAFLLDKAPLPLVERVTGRGDLAGLLYELGFALRDLLSAFAALDRLELPRQRSAQLLLACERGAELGPKRLDLGCSRCVDRSNAHRLPLHTCLDGDDGDRL